MRRPLRLLPLGFIPFLLALMALGVQLIHHPQAPVLIQKGYQSFVGVLMLLMQF